MATRAYRRDNRGRFAGGGGGGGGTNVTYGKAGGFANRAFAARVSSQASRSRARPPVRGRHRSLTRQVLKTGVRKGLVASAVLGGSYAAGVGLSRASVKTYGKVSNSRLNVKDQSRSVSNSPWVYTPTGLR